jgi:hypothetical protein
MRQEIQSALRETQPGAPVVLGELSAVEGVSAGRPAGPDSAPPHGEVQAAGCHPRNGRSVGQSGVDSGRAGGVAAGVLIAIIRGYQWTISPLLPNCCRFEPTCSCYAVEALRVHGFWRGAGLTIWRLLRCQPFCRGGLDPVPPPRKKCERPAEHPDARR